ncbi:MAG: DUF2231 domain-containing protein, partial [Candidatus Halalkalibacterium sp. M3_1C_030]
FFDFISFFLPKEKKWWTEEATAFLYGVGALAAIIVYYTGTLAADSVMLPAEAQSVLTEHADLAWVTIWFYGIYAVLRIAATWWGSEQHRLKFHIGFFLVSLIGMYFLFQTGDRGAQMVFQYGVGVQTSEIENPTQHDHTTDHDESGGASTDGSVSTSFNIQENGNWTWEIEQNALTALQQNFQWLSGNTESVNAEVVEVEDGYGLSFSGDNLNAFFTGEQSYETEQIDYYVDMSSFEGTVEFVSHVQNNENYDFVSISSDGTVRQGRIESSETTIFEEGNIDVSQTLFVRVVGNGTHFRGYINEKMVVHGHGDEPQPGNIGIKLNGSGTFLLQKMTVTQL